MLETFEKINTPFITEFVAPVPVTLKSDGTDTTLTLDEQQIDAKLRLRAVPRNQPVAYLEAEAVRPEGDWLPGMVQLVRDGSYVGETSWQPQLHDNLLLPFGSDSQVHVSYQRKQDRNGSSGVLSKQKVREVTDVYTITSLHRMALPLLVLESSPVATDDQIKVEKEFVPMPTTQDWESEPGIVSWEQTLNPKATLSIRAHYTLSYPEDRQATGLP
jgi:uncharacterized protein (TIGR02231 family)